MKRINVKTIQLKLDGTPFTFKEMVQEWANGYNIKVFRVYVNDKIVTLDGAPRNITADMKVEIEEISWEKWTDLQLGGGI